MRFNGVWFDISEVLSWDNNINRSGSFLDFLQSFGLLVNFCFALDKLKSHLISYLAFYMDWLIDGLLIISTYFISIAHIW